MTDATFDNNVHNALYYEGDNPFSAMTFREKWSDLILSALNAVGVLSDIVISDTPPVDTTALWLDTRPHPDLPSVLRVYNASLLQWDPVTQDDVFGQSAGSRLFDNLAAMVASPRVSVGDTVVTFGHTTPGDNGHSVYKIVDPGTGTADGILLVDLTGISGQAQLQHNGYVAGEQFGAVNGVESSAQIQAMIDGIVRWQQTQASPDDTPIGFSHKSVGTLLNQVTWRNPDDNTRLHNVEIDFTGSTLTATAGGNLSDTNAMFLMRLENSTARMGNLEGNKLVAAYDLNGCGESRIYSPRAVRFKGKGIQVRGASGGLEIHSPDVAEYESSDPEFNTDANFTAIGVSCEDGDFDVIGGEIRFCGTLVDIDPVAVQVEFHRTHFVNGNPNVGSGGSARVEPVGIVNRATRENHVIDCYIDNCKIDDQTGTLHIMNPHGVINSRATITDPSISIRATSAGQTDLPDVYYDSIRGVASVGLVDDGGNTWAGDITGLASLYSDMLDENKSVSITGTQFRIHLPNGEPSEHHYILQDAAERHYTTGSTTMQEEINPTTQEVRWRDTQTLRVQNASGDSEVLLGGGNLGIRESASSGGRLEIVTAGGGGSDGLAWFFQNDGDLVPQSDNTEDIGTTSNRVANIHANTLQGPAIVGTVSDTAGVSDGAIFESGSGANGEYIRFADGTMIARHTITTSASGGVSWTFPSAFSSAPVVVATTVNASFRVITVSAVGTSSATINGYNSAAARIATDAAVVAHGRWRT